MIRSPESNRTPYSLPPLHPPQATHRGAAEKFDPHDDRVQLAFRELEKLKPEDLDKPLRALAALRGQGEE